MDCITKLGKNIENMKDRLLYSRYIYLYKQSKEGGGGVVDYVGFTDLVTD